MTTNFNVTDALLLPFVHANEHCKQVQAAQWYGRVVHVIVGFLEYIPLLNYLVVLVELATLRLFAACQRTPPSEIKKMEGVFPSTSNELENTCVACFTNYLDPRNISRCERVCKSWNNFFKNQLIWIQLYKKEGMPFVEGKDRDRRADFQILYPITLSGKKISRFLGEPVGEIPFIREELFNTLNNWDPFEKRKSIIDSLTKMFFYYVWNTPPKEGKLKDNFEFIVDFPLIKRTAGEDTPLELDENGDLIELPADQVLNGKELIIPLSLKNLVTLCSYPLEGKKNKPAFKTGFSHNMRDILDQCGASPKEVNVYFMRRDAVDDETTGINLIFKDSLTKFVKNKGFNITSLRVRALFEAEVILRTGTCQDVNQKVLTYCSDMVFRNNKNCHTGLGYFFPGRGLYFDVGEYFYIYRVVPCVSAEDTLHI